MTAHAHERAHPVTISMTQSETQTSSEKMVSFNYAIVKMLALLCSYSPTLGAGDEQCTSGFLDLNSVDQSYKSKIVTLPDSSLPNTDRLSNFRRWIFPNIKLTCDGYITSWTLRVNNSMPESVDTALIPQITTWRLLGSNFYRQQSITTQSQLSSRKNDTWLMFTPSPPGIPVQDGDIVGIQLPPVNDDLLTIKPLFLRLSQGNSSISCAGLQGDSPNFQFDTANQMCGGNDQRQQQSLYIPLISVNNNTSTDAAASTPPFPTSTPPATTTMAPTPPPTDSRTTTSQDFTSGLTFTNLDLAASLQSGSGANSCQLVLIGGVISAITTLVLFLIVLTIFLAFLTKRRGKKLYNTVTISIPPQPQTDIDSTVYSQIPVIDSQIIEVKNNEAYSPSTTQQISTEDNVAYGQAISQIPAGDNVAYGQLVLQIPTEDNVAYYGHREDDYATVSVSDPTEYDYV